MDVDTLRQVIKTLEENNKLRYAEIEALQRRVRSLKARITKLLEIAARKNKERS